MRSASPSEHQIPLYIGTYREGPGIGISAAHFNTRSGALSTPVFVAESAQPTFLTVAPDGRHLHVCNETNPGSLTTFAIDPTDPVHLTPVSRVPSAGDSPCFIALDRTGRFVLVANYMDGTFAVFALDADGRLGTRTGRIQIPGSSVNPDRQRETHAHSFITDPSNRFALAADLGADRVYLHRFDATSGALAPNDPPSFALPPGSGPRHMRFHPNGRWVFIVNELNSSVTACAWDAERGALTAIQTVRSLPTDFTAFNTSAEAMVHPSGRTLYVSNRGFDAIAAFAVDPESGRLEIRQQTPTQGRLPRNFVIDPTARWLLVANQSGDSIVVFAIDPATGHLTQHGQPVAAKNPGCLRFLPVAQADFRAMAA